MDLVTHPSAPAQEPIRFSTDERLAGGQKDKVPRILIVEDDYVVGLELENALSEAGFEVVVEAALEMFIACGVRCIFATAHHDPRTRARAAKAAPLGWLPKPYQLDGLISMINAAVTELTKSRS